MINHNHQPLEETQDMKPKYKLTLMHDDIEYDFQQCNIKVTERDITDIFQYKGSSAYGKTKSLHDVIIGYKNKSKRYQDIAERVLTEYQEYLEYPIGKFLISLKNESDDFYKEFLNKYGDSAYCCFSIIDKEILNKKGLYAFSVGTDLKYIGKVTGCRTYRSRVNSAYGKISPEFCYPSGQTTSIRINIKVNLVIDEFCLFVCPLEKDEQQISTIEEKLIYDYDPVWNIKGRSYKGSIRKPIFARYASE